MSFEALHKRRNGVYPWMVRSEFYSGQNNDMTAARLDIANQIRDFFLQRSFYDWLLIELTKSKLSYNALESLIINSGKLSGGDDFDVIDFATKFCLAHRRLLINEVIIIPDCFNEPTVGDRPINLVRPLESQNSVGDVNESEFFSDFLIFVHPSTYKVGDVEYSTRFGWYEVKFPIRDSGIGEYYSVLVPVFALPKKCLDELSGTRQGMIALEDLRKTIKMANHDVVHNFLYHSGGKEMVARADFVNHSSHIGYPSFDILNQVACGYPKLEDFSIRIYAEAMNHSGIAAKFIAKNPLSRACDDIGISDSIELIQQVKSNHWKKMSTAACPEYMDIAVALVDTFRKCEKFFPRLPDLVADFKGFELNKLKAGHMTTFFQER